MLHRPVLHRLCNDIGGSQGQLSALIHDLLDFFENIFRQPLSHCAKIEHVFAEKFFDIQKLAHKLLHSAAWGRLFPLSSHDRAFLKTKKMLQKTFWNTLVHDTLFRNPLSLYLPYSNSGKKASGKIKFSHFHKNMCEFLLLSSQFIRRRRSGFSATSYHIRPAAATARLHKIYLIFSLFSGFCTGSFSLSIFSSAADHTFPPAQTAVPSVSASRGAHFPYPVRPRPECVPHGPPHHGRPAS